MSNTRHPLRSIILLSLRCGLEYSLKSSLVASSYFAIILFIPEFNNGIGILENLVFMLLAISVGFILVEIAVIIIPAILGSACLGLWLYHDWINNKFSFENSKRKGILGGFFTGVAFLIIPHFITNWKIPVFFLLGLLANVDSDDIQGLIFISSLLIAPLIFGSIIGMLLGHYLPEKIIRNIGAPSK